MLILVSLFVLLPASSQTDRPHEDLHGVLSRQPLEPPLRDANVTLRYSPDGRILKIQNSSGIYVLSREPLTLRTYIAAEDVYPARFSFDSQALTVIGHGLTLNREKLPDGPKLEQRELPFQDACLDAELSPGGDLFACLLPDFRLVVYRLSTNQVIFSDWLNAVNFPNEFVLVPLDANTAFPGPFGFLMANDWGSLAGRGMKFLSLNFSPDGKILLVRKDMEGFSVDLATQRKASLPGAFRKRMNNSLCLQNDERVLMASSEKEARAVMVSLKDGEILATFSFKAEKARLARNPRYALLSDNGVVGERIFDLDENRELDAPDNVSTDIFGNEVAALNDKGALLLYHLGEKLPFLAVDLPLDGLPVLRAATVTPSLDRFAFSVDGNGAAYQAETGERLDSTPGFSGAILSHESSAFLLLSGSWRGPSRVDQLDLSSGKSGLAWSGKKGRLCAGGSAFLEFTRQTPIGYRFVISRESEVPYQLRALDPETGKELWKREFLENSPVPFADPQGDRLVLAWDGNSLGAEEAAKRIPAVWRIFKKAKPTQLDTYFEVVQARSGKSVGGVLLQRGSGPYSFDAAFSVGDALFLVRDGRRITVLSLQDGSLRAQLVGGMPAANARSKLFAIEEGPGRLVIYDLATGTKLGQHIFLDPIAYSHFSADGNRLLVLTKYQVAYILDVSSLRHAPPSPFASTPR